MNKRCLISMMAAGLFLALIHWLSPPETLDARLFYTRIEAQSYLNQLGASDWRHYQWAEVMDLGFIYSYGFLFWFWGSAVNQKHIWLWIPSAFDAVETLSVLMVLLSHNPDWIWMGLGWITLAKWLSAFFVSLFLLGKSVKVL